MDGQTIFALHGEQSSLVVELPPAGEPLWRYWGPRLADDFDCGGALSALRPLASFSLEEPAQMAVFPGFGMGWFAQSALLAHRDGRDFAFAPTQAKVEHADGNRLSITLNDNVAGIGATLHLTLDGGSDVLTIRTSLRNVGAGPLSVQWLAAASLPLPAAAHVVRSTSGRHNSEFVPCEVVLGRGIWRRENRHGLTSHASFPGAVVAAQGCTAQQGLAFGVQMAWSGNHSQSIEWLDDGRWQWQIGEWLAPGEIQLAPGAMLDAPAVLATCSSQGWGGVARNFHAAIRANIPWPGGAMAPRPVHLNTWEGFYFDHDEQKLMDLADAAATVGVERFVLDDGWFAGRDDDTSSLGDWTVDARKYPNGLGPLAAHICKLGMQFGLWVEPEMVNPDSDLFRSHPDWAIQLAGRPLLTARNQLVLDLARRPVADYLFETLDCLLSSLPISYLKWDHNRDIVTAGGVDGRAVYHQQIVAAYALIDRLRQAHPDVEIEACAGGGGRIDAGLAARTHRFWTSDCIDAVSRVRMQRGFLQYMPPELMGSHIGTAPAHSTGRSQSLDFRAAVAMAGHFGLEFNLLNLSPDALSTVSQWVNFYKDWRHMLAGSVWTGEGADHVQWQANGMSGQWLLSIYRTGPSEMRYAPTLPLPFLSGEGDWRIKRIDPLTALDKADHNPARKDAAWRAGMTADASWLRNMGLQLPPMLAEEAAIFLLEPA